MDIKKDKNLKEFDPKWSSPVVYQINVKVLLTDLADRLGKAKATFDDIPNSLLSQLASQGFTFVYLLGVWTTGEAGLRAARRFMSEVHPQVPKEKVTGSPFAIYNYQVDSRFGGTESLQKLRQRLSLLGLGLILDFVPNHVAFDHPWVSAKHSECPKDSLILPGNLDLLRREPQNYFLAVEDKKEKTDHQACDALQVFQGDEALRYLEGKNDKFYTENRIAVLAHGRDPHFDGWRDTAQLNYYNPALRTEMTELLVYASNMCDAVRCDMANLVPWRIFNKTWESRYKEVVKSGNHSKLSEFWGEAISAVKKVSPKFKFIAEVYWSMEHELMQQGFDYCYDKNLYDKLRHSDAGEVRNYLKASVDDYQSKLTRFLENHDEDRAASFLTDPKQHRAAALICYTSPGMKFFHMGQLEGRINRIPVQMMSYAETNVTDDTKWSSISDQLPTKIADMYLRLFETVLCRSSVRNGKFRNADIYPSSDGSGSHSGIVAFARYHTNDKTSPLLIVVNYSPKWADGWVKVQGVEAFLQPPTSNSSSGLFNIYGGPPTNGLVMRDIYGSTEVYRKDWNEVKQKGVWFGLDPWQCHVFEFLWR